MKFFVYLLYFYFFIFIFGQFSKISLQSPEINLYLTDIIIGIIVSAWFLLKLIKKEKISKAPLTFPILTFISIALISLISNSLIRLNGRELIVAWLYLFRWVIYSGLYFLTFDLLNNKVINKEKIEGMLIITGLSFSISGLIQYIFLPDTRFLETFGWDPHYYRLIGNFFDPGFTGAILAITLILIIYKLLTFKSFFAEKAYFISGLIVYISLALTYSRASYLLFLVGVTFISISLKKYKFLMAILFLGIITIFLLPRPGGEGVRLERESTIIFRIINWQQSSKIISNNFFLGTGFNAYRYTQRDYGFLPLSNWQASHAGGGADSSLLFIFATTGIFGLIAYLWIWGRSFFLALKQNNLVLAAIILGLLIHSLFVNSLFYPWIMSWIWIIFAFVNNEKNS